MCIQSIGLFQVLGGNKTIYMYTSKKPKICTFYYPGTIIVIKKWKISCCIFEPTCVHAQWALRNRFLSVCHPWQKFRLEKIHISKSIQPRVMKFSQGMNANDPKADLKGQGHQVKKCDFSLIGQSFKSCSHSQGCPWSWSKVMYGSRSKVTGLKVSIKLMIFGRWAHINVKLLHFLVFARIGGKRMCMKDQK